MQKLNDSLSAFQPPKLSASEWEKRNREARLWEIEQQMKKDAERLKRTQIPARYHNAALDQCDARVSDWCKRVEAGAYENLLLIGEVGRGKTHAACAAMLYLLPSMRCMFATFDDILDEIKDTYNGYGSEYDVLYKYGNVPVLCIDDFGKTRPTEWSMPILFKLLDHRSRNQHPTIITSQYDANGMYERMIVNNDSEFAKAILSRLSEGICLSIIGEDRRSQ